MSQRWHEAWLGIVDDGESKLDVNFTMAKNLMDLNFDSTDLDCASVDLISYRSDLLFFWKIFHCPLLYISRKLLYDINGPCQTVSEHK